MSILKACIVYSLAAIAYEVFHFLFFIFEDLLIFECLLLEIYSKYNILTIYWMGFYTRLWFSVYTCY